MTTRERVSLVLVLAGGVALVLAVAVIGGPWWGLAVAGGLSLIVGALLGLEDRPVPFNPAEFDELGGPSL